MRNWFPIVGFICCVFLGYWLTAHSWNGMLFVYLGEQRAPAAVRALGDFSEFNRSLLYKDARSELLARAQVIRKNGDIGIQLGHFLVAQDDGSKEFACQVQDHVGVYDRIELTFIGEGVSEDGEPPKMVVTADCHSGHRLDRLATIWVPLQKIVSTKPNDKDWNTYGDHAVAIQLRSIPDQWPDKWTLWSVRFFKASDPASSYAITSDQLLQSDKRISFSSSPLAPQKSAQ